MLALAAAVSNAGAQSQPPTFRATTRLVEVNVVVQDARGRPVTDLHRGDFTLYEDGKEQPIELFAVESSQGASSTTQAPGTPQTPRPESPALPPAASDFTNRLAVRGGITIILFDRLNTSFEDQRRARDQIASYLGRLSPGDRVALYVLESDVVRVLHDFTADSASLVKAMSRSRSKASQAAQAANSTPIAPANSGSASEDLAVEAWLSDSMTVVSEFFLRNRAQSTMAAFETIAQRLAGIRGRKNLVWVSSAFPMVYRTRFGPETMARAIDHTTRMINEANIAVYAVDARGLVPPYALAAAEPTKEVNRRDRSAMADAPPSGLSTRAKSDALESVADATGGRAFTSMNDVGKAIARAVEDSRLTYLLGYHAAYDVFDRSFHTIRVTVNRPGVTVRSRKGYVATSPSRADPASPEALLAVAKSPFEATGLQLTAQVEPIVSQASGDDVQIAIRLDGKSITLEKSGDHWLGSLDLLITQGQRDGRVFKSFAATVDLRFTDAEREQLLREGFSVSRTIPLRPDAHRVHVVVRDVPSAATGSVIVPVVNLPRVTGC